VVYIGIADWGGTQGKSDPLAAPGQPNRLDPLYETTTLPVFEVIADQRFAKGLKEQIRENVFEKVGEPAEVEKCHRGSQGISIGGYAIVNNHVEEGPRFPMPRRDRFQAAIRESTPDYGVVGPLIKRIGATIDISEGLSVGV
jgi:hypothetical protein